MTRFVKSLCFILLLVPGAWGIWVQLRLNWVDYPDRPHRWIALEHPLLVMGSGVAVILSALLVRALVLWWDDHDPRQPQN